jgi:phospholipid/cholesterol/gamma-HCH transport system substrate-binding protein
LKNKREFIAGLSGLFAIAIVYWGISFLKGEDVFSSKRVFYAEYEKVDGLMKSQPIIIKGFMVGKVEDISFKSGFNNSFIVRFNLTNEVDFPANSIANIVSTDFLGGKAVEILLGDATTPAQSGDTLASSITASFSEEINKQVAPLKDKLDHIFGSLDTIIMAVSAILNDKTSEDITVTIQNLRNTFARIDQSVNKLDQLVSNNEQGLDQTLKDIATVASSLKDNTQNFNNIASNFSNLSDTLVNNNPGESLRKLKQSIDETSATLAKLNRGEGNVGKLAHDEELYNNLVKASDQLNKLLLDVKYNPKRYVGFSVFGRSREYTEQEIQEMEYGPQEEKEKNKK